MSLTANSLRHHHRLSALLLPTPLCSLHCALNPSQMAPTSINRAKKPYSVSLCALNVRYSIALTRLHFQSQQRPAPAARSQGIDGKWLHDKAPGLPRAVQNTAAAKASNGITNTRIIVSNLHYEVTPKDLSVRPHPCCLSCALACHPPPNPCPPYPYHALAR